MYVHGSYAERRIVIIIYDTVCYNYLTMRILHELKSYCIAQNSGRKNFGNLSKGIFARKTLANVLNT